MFEPLGFAAMDAFQQYKPRDMKSGWENLYFLVIHQASTAHDAQSYQKIIAIILSSFIRKVTEIQAWPWAGQHEN